MVRSRSFQMALMLIVSVCVPQTVLAQSPDKPLRVKNKVTPLALSVHLDPGVELPLGEYSQYYKLGGSLGLSTELRYGGLPFFVTAGINYNYDPRGVSTSLSYTQDVVWRGV